jgi:hypothetical protein
VLVLQQINRVLAQRSQEGWYPERFDCACTQRPAPAAAAAPPPPPATDAAAAAPAGDADCTGAGYADAATAGGASGDSGGEGAAQHNVSFNILLKRTVPLLPAQWAAPPQLGVHQQQSQAQSQAAQQLQAQRQAVQQAQAHAQAQAQQHLIHQLQG